jgi:hypothetical protein
MPALRAYRSKEGHYALAGIKGRIVTYRLSLDGAKQLHDSGIADDGKFPWSLLLELIRQGDAFTGNSGGTDEDLSGWTQQGFVFDGATLRMWLNGGAARCGPRRRQICTDPL